MISNDNYCEGKRFYSRKRFTKKNYQNNTRRNHSKKGIMNQDTYYGNEYNYNLKPFQKLEYVKKTPPPNNKFDSSPDIIEEIKSLPASTL